MRSLVSLAEELLAQAKQLDALLEQNGEPSPSATRDTLEILPQDAQKLRAEFMNTSYNIQKLARGAKLSALDIAFNWTDHLVLRIVWHYKLAFAIPIDGSATYDQISAASGLARSLVSRVVRAAIPLNIFDQSQTGEVYHTAISRLLVEDSGLSNCIGLQVQDLGPASARLIEAWEAFGFDAGDPSSSAFSLAHDGRSLFTVLAQEPQVAERFNLAMEFCCGEKEFNFHDIAKAFDWKSLDRPGSCLIDLGGNYGHVSQMLARHTRDLKFVVQDLAHAVDEGQKKLPLELRDRLSFETRDFFQDQPADDPPCAFLISRCLHNWSDRYCTKILRALIPALRTGSRVLVWDIVQQEEPVRKLTERFNLQQDFIMATVSNGTDRTLAEFEKIFKLSDDRFKVEGLQRPDGSKLSMIEVTWS